MVPLANAATTSFSTNSLTWPCEISLGENCLVKFSFWVITEARLQFSDWIGFIRLDINAGARQTWANPAFSVDRLDGWRLLRPSRRRTWFIIFGAPWAAPAASLSPGSPLLCPLNNRNKKKETTTYFNQQRIFHRIVHWFITTVIDYWCRIIDLQLMWANQIRQSNAAAGQHDKTETEESVIQSVLPIQGTNVKWFSSATRTGAYLGQQCRVKWSAGCDSWRWQPIRREITKVYTRSRNQERGDQTLGI